MFCPECKTEYREGFTECADCGVSLIDGASADPAAQIDAIPAMPMVGVWRGQDHDKAFRVSAALERAGLATELQLVAANTWEVRVFARAAEPAGDVILEALSHQDSSYATAAPREPAQVRICPLCAEEYDPPLRFCRTCMIQLAESGDGGQGVEVWSGDHPGDAYLVKAAMTTSGIPYYLGGEQQRLHLFEPRFPLGGKRYALWVLPQDEGEARTVVGSLRLSNLTEIDALPPDEPAPVDPFAREEEVEIDWVPVWSGSNIEELEALRYVFRENAIPMRVQDADAFGRKHLDVPARNRDHARSIIMQVLEGEVPPELTVESETEDTQA